MAFCPYCGQQVDGTMSFCPSCGKSLTGVFNSAVTPIETSTVTPVVTTQPVERNDYRVILLSAGSASSTTATELLEDVMGYTKSEAKTLLANLPTEIAHTLTYQQAQYIAQALSEYGMQVSVCNSDGYIDVGTTANTSVFDNKGNFLTHVAAALALITVANRVREARRYDRPGLFDHIFAPRYRRPAPPMHQRRPIHEAPPPRRPEPPRPVAPRPSAPRSTPRPPMGGGMGRTPGARGGNPGGPVGGNRGGNRGPSGGRGPGGMGGPSGRR
jgi:hypothetical protein